MELTVESLTKQYPKKLALDHVSFTLTEGVYGLLGPNGAGKTTMIQMIAGILRPTSGNILWKGRNIGELNEQYREILGFQPQGTGLHGGLSAEYRQSAGKWKTAQPGIFRWHASAVVHRSSPAGGSEAPASG